MAVWVVGPVMGQEATPDSVKKPVWNKELISRLSAAQTGYRNWSKGGVNSLAATTRLDGNAVRTQGAWQQKHEMRLAYGVVKQDTLDFRKADDLIHLSSALQYKGDGFFRHFNPTVAAQIRTQFAPGYEYKKKGDREPPFKVSDFLAPLSATQTIGLTYDPAPWFTQRIGIGGKETLVTIRQFRPSYMGEGYTRPVKLELGIESRTNFKREIVDNVALESNLNVFAAIVEADVPDVIWENNLAMKVNSWLAVNLTVDLIYDEDYKKAIQMREVFALSFSFKLI